MPSPPGPVPNRSDQRRRRNKDDIDIEKAAPANEATIPDANPEWVPAVTRWYEALGESGQAVFYESSDWAQAWILADLLNSQMDSFKPNGMIISAWLHGAGELLTTEGARRRMRIELAKGKKADPEQVAAIASLDAFRDRFGS